MVIFCNGNSCNFQNLGRGLYKPFIYRSHCVFLTLNYCVQKYTVTPYLFVVEIQLICFLVYEVPSIFLKIQALWVKKLNHSLVRLTAKNRMQLCKHNKNYLLFMRFYYHLLKSLSRKKCLFKVKTCSFL